MTNLANLLWHCCNYICDNVVLILTLDEKVEGCRFAAMLWITLNKMVELCAVETDWTTIQAVLSCGTVSRYSISNSGSNF